MVSHKDYDFRYGHVSIRVYMPSSATGVIGVFQIYFTQFASYSPDLLRFFVTFFICFFALLGAGVYLLLCAVCSRFAPFRSVPCSLLAFLASGVCLCGLDKCMA